LLFKTLDGIPDFIPSHRKEVPLKRYGMVIGLKREKVLEYKHFMERYHPEKGDLELIEAALRARGFATARDL
jgi:hypothetical protein